MVTYKSYIAYLDEETAWGTIPVVDQYDRHIADLWQDADEKWCCEAVGKDRAEKSYKTPDKAVKSFLKQLHESELEFTDRGIE